MTKAELIKQLQQFDDNADVTYEIPPSAIEGNLYDIDNVAPDKDIEDKQIIVLS